MSRMEDAHDPFLQEASIVVESNGRREQVTPLTFVETMRSINERILKS